MAKKIQKTRGRRKASTRFGRRRHVPDIKPERYADGLPFNEVQYLECKLILRANHFTVAGDQREGFIVSGFEQLRS